MRWKTKQGKTILFYTIYITLVYFELSNHFASLLQDNLLAQQILFHIYYNQNVPVGNFSVL